MSFNTDDEDVKTQRKLFLFLGTLVGLVTFIVLLYAMVVDGQESQKNQAVQDAAIEYAAEQPATADSQEIAEGNGLVASAPVVIASAPVAAVTIADGARVVVEGGVVKFYFASGKTDLASGADEALKEVIAGVKAGKKALVSGFHDRTGTLAVNEQVSKERAFAVRDALVRLGVAESQIELVKPQITEGSGDGAEARRVEVVLQ